MSEPSKRKPLPVLSVRGLNKTFTVGGQTVEALRNVDLRIEKGEFVCLIGASGCGKSTLLRILAGFETATDGVVEMYGKPINGPSPERGMVFQDYGLFPWLTVAQNIAFGPRQRGMSAKQLHELSMHYTDMVGLGKFANYYPGQLSGGMKQRVAIARVLANDCDVLLMDEPFGALDALTRERLQQELLDIWARTGVTIIFVTHAVEEAVMLSDRVVVMTAGPGRIERDIALELPRPRDITGIEFNQVRRDITQYLSSHVAIKAAA
ncbi:ABC transporter ATP-binding protein [Pigmentiphaga aceris]|uniref:ABC transporter ATP-binding protein n=1 Tax=Pigmentiphaga aceris TaxID=1940612 RepID=A0A5C0ATL9_9BURK|nr:ABC transporter ATP-binding protein [Pigmentiphaga aceris]QEI05425.1 ABC transporter ATP-binding protein [Pigmentiphaga aceris]